jgi:mRNA interferase HigB
MTLLGKQKIASFKARYPHARSRLEAWEAEVEEAKWTNPHEMKQQFPSADPVGDLNTVFNIKGNDYRLWALVDYENQIVVVKEVGTHVEYKKWRIK